MLFVGTDGGNEGDGVGASSVRCICAWTGKWDQGLCGVGRGGFSRMVDFRVF